MASPEWARCERCGRWGRVVLYLGMRVGLYHDRCKEEARKFRAGLE